jgi:hypothetical protein
MPHGDENAEHREDEQQRSEPDRKTLAHGEIQPPVDQLDGSGSVGVHHASGRNPSRFSS